MLLWWLSKHEFSLGPPPCLGSHPESQPREEGLSAPRLAQTAVGCRVGQPPAMARRAPPARACQPPPLLMDCHMLGRHAMLHPGGASARLPAKCPGRQSGETLRGTALQSPRSAFPDRDNEEQPPQLESVRLQPVPPLSPIQAHPSALVGLGYLVPTAPQVRHPPHQLSDCLSALQQPENLPLGCGRDSLPTWPPADTLRHTRLAAESHPVSPGEMVALPDKPLDKPLLEA